MLDHVSLPVVDLARSAAFYDVVLAPLGLVRRKALGRAVPECTQPFYGAFAFDLDGFKIEAVYRAG